MLLAQGMEDLDDSKSPERKAARASRFKDLLSIDTTLDEVPSSGTSPRKLKGRSTRLEKSYVRLSGAAPDPNKVRPLTILKKALEMVKTKYLEDENSYEYTCDQLKSIRQDLTVQCIRGRFSAHVYETHVRIALECKDLPEYCQCSSVLQEMRKQGTVVSEDELDCYRVLYALHIDSKMELACVLRDVGVGRGVEWALEVLEAIRHRNTLRFFSLYQKAPYQSVYLLDLLLSKQRTQALAAILTAYIAVPVTAISSRLHFKSIKRCERFLAENGAVVVADEVDCKASLASEQARGGRPTASEKQISAPASKSTAMPTAFILAGASSSFGFSSSSSDAGVLGALSASRGGNNKNSNNNNKSSGKKKTKRQHQEDSHQHKKKKHKRS